MDRMIEEPPLPEFNEELFEGMSEEEVIQEMELMAATAGDVQRLYTDAEGMTLKEKIVLMNTLRIQLDRIKSIKTSIQLRYDALRLNIIPSTMDNESVSSITVDGVGRVSLTSDLYCSIPKDMKMDTWQWLRDNNLGSIIQQTINSSTLKATIKNVLLKGATQIPDGLFKITPFTRASITKTTAK